MLPVRFYLPLYYAGRNAPQQANTVVTLTMYMLRSATDGSPFGYPVKSPWNVRPSGNASRAEARGASPACRPRSTLQYQRGPRAVHAHGKQRSGKHQLLTTMSLIPSAAAPSSAAARALGEGPSAALGPGTALLQLGSTGSSPRNASTRGAPPRAPSAPRSRRLGLFPTAAAFSLSFPRGLALSTPCTQDQLSRACPCPSTSPQGRASSRCLQPRSKPRSCGGAMAASLPFSCRSQDRAHLPYGGTPPPCPALTPASRQRAALGCRRPTLRRGTAVLPRPPQVPRLSPRCSPLLSRWQEDGATLLPCPPLGDQAFRLASSAGYASEQRCRSRAPFPKSSPCPGKRSKPRIVKACQMAVSPCQGGEM